MVTEFISNILEMKQLFIYDIYVFHHSYYDDHA